MDQFDQYKYMYIFSSKLDIVAMSAYIHLKKTRQKLVVIDLIHDMIE